MNAVIGLCTTPEKYDTTQSKIIPCVVAPVTANQGAVKCPNPAPMEKDGSNNPPGIPVSSTIMVAAARCSAYHGPVCSRVAAKRATSSGGNVARYCGLSCTMSARA